MSTISRLYFSADEDYLATAADELRPFFPTADMEPIGPDIAAFEDEGVSIAILAETIRKEHLAFTRHLMRGVGEVPHADAEDLGELGDIALELWDRLPMPDMVSLHVWQSGEADFPYRNDQLWRRLAAALNDIDIEVVRGGASHILSACQTGHGIIFGTNGAANALSDWPGGRVKLAKPKGQISRAEFKLEELFRSGEIQLPASGKALDLGAAPGGWSRILIDRGFEVWAVDPGDLDRRLLGRPGLHHVKSTAGPFLAETAETYDLVVNDMRMEPGLSASIMNSAVRHLSPDGLGIMSMKLQPEHPLPVIDNAFRVLGKSWEPVFVRQLHHNRNEITAVIRPKR